MLVVGIVDCAASSDGRRTYSVPVLGDIHFDSPDPKFYHANYTHSSTGGCSTTPLHSSRARMAGIFRL